MSKRTGLGRGLGAFLEMITRMQKREKAAQSHRMKPEKRLPFVRRNRR
ncbi:MAG: hypothetical protein ACLT76_16920 [Clostridium fessum]